VKNLRFFTFNFLWAVGPRKIAGSKALALSYLISDDGGFCPKSRRVTLATNCFTLEAVQLLAQALKDNFNLICYINKHGNGYVIRISSKSLPVLQELLKDKMPSMMLYKIGL